MIENGAKHGQVGAPLRARSLLFVPGDDARKLARAWTAEAGAIILDLEDAVLGKRKPVARALTAQRLADRPARAPVIVRINALETDDGRADLHWLEEVRRVEAVLIPKASAASLAALPCLGRPVIALIETAAGVLDSQGIALLPTVSALMLGTIDLAAELGIEITSDGRELQAARSALVLAAAAAGLPAPIDGVWLGVEDLAGLRDEASSAKVLGFRAKACIHPSQVPVVEEVFRPSEIELEHARRVLSATELAASAGQGVVKLDGCMVDRPVVERARRILANQ
jgi:citrate lyase beta subunit